MREQNGDRRGDMADKEGEKNAVCFCALQRGRESPEVLKLTVIFYSI